LSAFIAAFFLVLSLTAKIPSSHCHCNDPVKSKKEACPFGALRALTFAPPVVAPPMMLVEVGELAPAFFGEMVSVSTDLQVQYHSRAPPT